MQWTGYYISHVPARRTVRCISAGDLPSGSQHCFFRPQRIEKNSPINPSEKSAHESDHADAVTHVIHPKIVRLRLTESSRIMVPGASLCAGVVGGLTSVMHDPRMWFTGEGEG